MKHNSTRQKQEHCSIYHSGLLFQYISRRKEKFWRSKSRKWPIQKVCRVSSFKTLLNAMDKYSIWFCLFVTKWITLLQSWLSKWARLSMKPETRNRTMRMKLLSYPSDIFKTCQQVLFATIPNTNTTWDSWTQIDTIRSKLKYAEFSDHWAHICRMEIRLEW